MVGLGHHFGRPNIDTATLCEMEVTFIGPHPHQQHHHDNEAP
jgi:hypothetical protein